jgi:hypothetical protein
VADQQEQFVNMCCSDVQHQKRGKCQAIRLLSAVVSLARAELRSNRLNSSSAEQALLGNDFNSANLRCCWSTATQVMKGIQESSYKGHW